MPSWSFLVSPRAFCRSHILTVLLSSHLSVLDLFSLISGSDQASSRLSIQVCWRKTGWAENGENWSFRVTKIGTCAWCMRSFFLFVCFCCCCCSSFVLAGLVVLLSFGTCMNLRRNARWENMVFMIYSILRMRGERSCMPRMCLERTSLTVSHTMFVLASFLAFSSFRAAFCVSPMLLVPWVLLSPAERDTILFLTHAVSVTPSF